MSTRIHICLTFFFGLVAFLFVPICSAEVLLSDGQLTVQVDGMPLTAILEEISRQGNISIQTHGTLAGQMVTIHLGPLPLEKGLQRLLKKNNYLATFDKNGTIVKLTISSKASAPFSGGYNVIPQVEPAIPVPSEPSETVPPQEQPPDTPELPESKNE